MAKRQKKIKYTFAWGNHQALLTFECNLSAFAFHRKNEWNQVSNVIQISQNHDIRCFHGTEDLEADKKRGRAFFDYSYCKNFLVQINHNYKVSWKLFKKLKNIDYKKLSDRDLFGLLAEVKNNWIKQISFFRASQAEGTDALAEKLRDNFSEKEIPVIIHRLKPDISDLEMEEWRKIAEKGKASDEILLKHVDKFPWLAASHFQLTDVLDTLRNRLGVKTVDDSARAIMEKRILNKKQKRILSKAPAKIKWYVKTFHELSIARMKTKACWAGTDYYAIPLVKEIALRTGESVVDINRYYLTEDIKNLLLLGKKVVPAEKKRREFCFMGLWKNNRLIFKSGREALMLAKSELGELLAPKSSEELEGVGASPGKVRGLVRILMSNNIENAKKLRKEFKKGQILVGQMTQPNNFDVAKRAGAIITDEGGMLSHAAIISREFGIPCVVGTHKATQVLREGDLVEVDADHGIVKILKRNNNGFRKNRTSRR